MSFHCDKLCAGPCCLILLGAIEFANSSTLHVIRRSAPRPTDPHGASLYDVHDPAKLAGLYVLALRARGWYVYDDDPGDDLRLPGADVFVDGEGIGIHAYVTWEDGQDEPRSRGLTMSEARTLLAAIMLTPANESSRDAVIPWKRFCEAPHERKR